MLLEYILPWLHNMELVDPNVPPQYYQVSNLSQENNCVIILFSLLSIILVKVEEPKEMDGVLLKLQRWF